MWHSVNHGRKQNHLSINDAQNMCVFPAYEENESMTNQIWKQIENLFQPESGVIKKGRGDAFAIRVYFHQQYDTKLQWKQLFTYTTIVLYTIRISILSTRVSASVLFLWRSFSANPRERRSEGPMEAVRCLSDSGWASPQGLFEVHALHRCVLSLATVE